MAISIDYDTVRASQIRFKGNSMLPNDKSGEDKTPRMPKSSNDDFFTPMANIRPSHKILNSRVWREAQLACFYFRVFQLKEESSKKKVSPFSSFSGPGLKPIRFIMEELGDVCADSI
ncbi:hypothetical protein KIN20_035706 [Parelaphostrongylus tenuis]|uniref:Uncharacterized protein n=1 Tax=Parelaphostrongylus tenuis TaxID=148309 RepID=A0AAD5RC59_PARTN|nr:hypothetical protein KIN20_035706 [Parelaphostrongylus tenuis]